MKRFIIWFFSGIAFAAGILSVAYIYENHIKTSDETRKFSRLELKNFLEIKSIKPTKAEDRLAFNVLVKNTSEKFFSYAWLRIELYDAQGEFISSCDKTNGVFEEKIERWVQIKCGLAGYNYNPEYAEIKYDIMSAELREKDA